MMDIKYSPSFTRDLKIQTLEEENLTLKIALAESEEMRLQNDIETKLAIAELAEVVVNG
ncbi:MAG: hypothetical protein PHW03_07235 [Eubacteriales bacterium]|nr:hypothetical protein [Eubacteriales bacterium]